MATNLIETDTLVHLLPEDATIATVEQKNAQMTVDDIERACNEGRVLDFSRHALHAPELTLRQTFYPLGFPTVVRTNSPEILAQARRLWSVYSERFHTEPIRVDVHVVEGSSEECPPT